MKKMYKGKMECVADETQVEAMKKHGWSLTKIKRGPKPKVKPPADVKPAKSDTGAVSVE